MAKKKTHDAALSRLFGNVTEQVSAGPRRAEGSVAAEADRRPSPAGNQPAQSISRAASGHNREREGRGGADSGMMEPEPAAPSGYIGLGRYSRVDGIVERITPYVRPDQAEALRIAVARKNDPRGTDVSQIIQSLLDEAGYRS